MPTGDGGARAARCRRRKRPHREKPGKDRLSGGKDLQCREARINGKMPGKAVGKYDRRTYRDLRTFAFVETTEPLGVYSGHGCRHIGKEISAVQRSCSYVPCRLTNGARALPRVFTLGDASWRGGGGVCHKSSSGIVSVDGSTY
uniref:Uncharacterized protein n=1 Tax=Oryza meridionalis TaxID=40149 RepID=A0A0E0EMP1_9ORYZ